MNPIRLISLVVLCLFLAGCAEIGVSNTDNVMTVPVGGGGLREGMRASEVVAQYGEPDMKRTVRSDEWGGTREEWYYRARYDTIIPANMGYFSQDLYLYFDGDNLTKISKRPVGTEEDEEIKNAEKSAK